MVPLAFPLACGECFFVALSQNTLGHASKVLHHQWLACVHDPAWGVWVTIGKLVGAIVWIAFTIGFVLFAMVLQPIFMAFVRHCHTSELSCGLSWLIHLSHLVFGVETQQLCRSYWAQCVTLHTYVTRTHTHKCKDAMLFCISFASFFSVLLVMAPAALSGTHTMTTQENLLPCKTHDQECSQHSPTIQKHLKELCQSRNTYSACTESLQCRDVAADLQPFAHQWLDISSFTWHGQQKNATSPL